MALIDHDALAEPDGAERAVARVPGGGGAAVYRGWMLTGGQYAVLAGALAARGTDLRTSAAQYRQAHELPGWYPALAPVTPAAAWTAGDGEQEFHAACARLGPGPAVLRDYVKSMKHYWHQAAYIPDAADHGAAWKVAARFRELREDDFTGGFVLRRFEKFTSAEVRTWWAGGTCRMVTAHPDTPDPCPLSVRATRSDWLTQYHAMAWPGPLRRVTWPDGPPGTRQPPQSGLRDCIFVRGPYLSNGQVSKLARGASINVACHLGYLSVATGLKDAPSFPTRGHQHDLRYFWPASQPWSTVEA